MLWQEDGHGGREGSREDRRMAEERCTEGEGACVSDSRRLSELKEDVVRLKQSLAELVDRKRAIAAAMTRVVEGRGRVCLRQRVYEDSKQRLKTEYEELQELSSSNQRREDRLARVRHRDFSGRLETIRRECEEQRKKVGERRGRLQENRRELVVALQTSVFPIQVDPLSVNDAGEEDYRQSAVIDCNAVVDVDDGWVLSGVHQSPSPHASIITASLPLNGDFSLYIAAAEERRKRLKTASETGAPLPPVTAPGLHPREQPYLSVPAGLQFTAQLVELLADLLDTPLPHPLHRPLSILEYGNQNKRRRSFEDSLARLDDNIVYLCFSQNVPLSALSARHTLSNLLALVTHSELGRQGSFQCQPELATYRGDGSAGLSDPESDPPSLYTAADQPLTELEGDPVEGDKEEWASVGVKGGLEYGSGYLDFMSLGASRTDPGEGGEGEARTLGLFGTISSILSSTFTTRSTTS